MVIQASAGPKWLRVFLQGRGHGPSKKMKMKRRLNESRQSVGSYAGSGPDRERDAGSNRRNHPHFHRLYGEGRFLPRRRSRRVLVAAGPGMAPVLLGGIYEK